MAEAVVPLSHAADVEALVHDHDAPSALPELPVHVLVQARQRVVRFGHVELERHLPTGVAQPRGCSDESRLSPHGLQDRDGLGHAHAAVLLVDVLDERGPVPGCAAVPRGMIDDRELRVPNVIVDGLRDAGHDELHAPVPGKLGHLCRRVHGIVAANIEEVSDIVGLR